MNNSREDADNGVCPSFNSYSASGLAEVAVRVAVEESTAASSSAVGGGWYGGDEDFEFALVCEDEEVSEEDFFCGGKLGPVFPVFNRDLLRSDGGEVSASGEGKAVVDSSIAVPLSKLFIEEDHERGGDDPPSCSSSEADELESIPAGTYCVWRPKMPDSPVPNQCKKSKSTGSASKRWKFRDLMRRSNSDGKDSFVFLTPKHRDEKSEKAVQAADPNTTKAKGHRSISGRAPPSPSAHEVFYIQNRAMKAEDKKKSYLPYRRDLVGFFANVNGMRRNFPHV